MKWLLPIGALLAACGSRTELDMPSDLSSALPSRACRAPIWVPPGKAWVGGLRVDAIETEPTTGFPTEFEVRADQCTDRAYMPLPNTFVEVGGFYLDEDEVTYACYEECVEQGSCDALPAGQGPTFAAALSADQAARFCAFRGGRLPSYAELVRAAVGEAVAFSESDLWLDLARCISMGADVERCRGLLDATLWPGFELHDKRPLWPARSEPRDQGPFGHRDLFGGIGERSTTAIALDTQQSALLCGARFEEQLDVLDGPANAVYLASAALRNCAIIAEYGSGECFHVLDRYNDGTQFFEAYPGYLGARCAYDLAGSSEGEAP